MMYLQRSVTLVAFAVAPLATIFLLCVRAVIDVVRSGQGFSEVTRTLLSVAVITGVFAYAASIVLGAPSLVLFRRAKITNPIAYAAGGGAIALVNALILDWIGIADFSDWQFGGKSWADIAWILVCGILSGYLFWFLEARGKHSRA